VAMADLDISNDPAAEFLAREQETLAGLEDEFDTGLSLGKSATSTDVISDLNDPVNGDDDEFHLNNGHVDNGYNGETNGTSAAPAPPPQPESEKIRIWREEQTLLLESKDAEEAQRKEELRVHAKQELEEWYTRYADQLEKTKLNNRNAEKEWIAERDAEKPGQEWDKIAKLCDFNPKSVRNTKDTSRMRSILFQLKQ